MVTLDDVDHRCGLVRGMGPTPNLAAYWGQQNEQSEFVDRQPSSQGNLPG
jgi:hypothetical protein